MPESFEFRLSKALQINEAKDAPVDYKHEGKKKKTAKGTHRFDDGIEFVQMNHDGLFKNGSLTNLAK